MQRTLVISAASPYVVSLQLCARASWHTGLADGLLAKSILTSGGEIVPQLEHKVAVLVRRPLWR
jgi:hypothetical protein